MTDRPSHALRPLRLLVAAPSVAAVLVLLVGSVLPAAPPPRPDGVRVASTATAGATLPVELPPASVTQLPERGPAPPRPVGATGRAGQALYESSPWSVPDALLAAYRRAVAGAPPGCHLPVSLLAAIGQVESGSLAGRSLDTAHRSVPPVLGPVLDGVGTAAIRDTDGGRLDGNRRWDRAVGPMQFIPGTWAAFGVDADGDGQADPQDIYDAAAAAAGYLCARGRDLALPSGLRSAILAYNHSASYLATVLAWQHRFAASGGGASLAVNVSLNAPTAHPTTRHNGTVRKRTAASLPSTPVIVHTATKLAFTTAPSPIATSETALVTQPVVSVQDVAGNIITTNASSVTLALTTPAGASLVCAANPAVATHGVASFAGCAIDKTGTYTLTATAGSLTSAISISVTITAAAAAKLAFTTAPSPTATSGTALVTQPVVSVQDVAGNIITTNASSVTLALTTPAGASLVCAANPAVATHGVASFAGCAIDKTGTYTLTATAGSLTSAISSSVTITPGAATKFAIASAPVSGSVSATASLGPITVQRQDSYGNAVPAPAGGTPVILSSGSAGSTVFATTMTGTPVTSLIIPAGASSATFYYGDTNVGSPVITVSGPLTSASQTETITAAAVTV